MKIFRKDSATIPSTQHILMVDNRLDNANMLNNYFSKCFTTSLPPQYGSFQSAEHLGLELPEIGRRYVQRRRLYKCLLQSILLDVSKASGPDQISGGMF